MSDFEEKWKKSQIVGWKKDKEEAVLFFKRFGIELGDLYNQILDLEYEKMRTACFLLSKMRMITMVCDFLDQQAKKKYWDVDVMKLYFLISHAEIAMKTFGGNGYKNGLVRKYFEPVVDKYKLNYKIKLSFGGFPKNKERNLSATDILYKIRCEYVHEGNYTGKFFKDENAEKHVYNIFIFKRDNLEILCGECSLTYKSFINIYMEALAENIKSFLKN